MRLGRLDGAALLLAHSGIVDAAALRQLRIEPGLDRTDGQVLAIRAFVRAIKVGAAAEHVFAVAVVPLAGGAKAIIHRGQQCGAIASRYGVASI